VLFFNLSKAWIDFEFEQGERERTRALYEALLKKTGHVKVSFSAESPLPFLDALSFSFFRPLTRPPLLLLYSSFRSGTPTLSSRFNPCPSPTRKERKSERRLEIPSSLVRSCRRDTPISRLEDSKRRLVPIPFYIHSFFEVPRSTSFEASDEEKLTSFPPFSSFRRVVPACGAAGGLEGVRAVPWNSRGAGKGDGDDAEGCEEVEEARGWIGSFGGM